MEETEELLDFDLSSQDISEFDPLIYKMTPEIEQALELASKMDESKANKKDAIENLVVNVYGVPFAADDVSQNRLSATGTIANWLFNKNISVSFETIANDPDTDDVTKAMLTGLSQIFEGVYKQVYKDTKIGWKGADDKIHLVQGETVLQALYASMQAVGDIIQKAEKGELAED